MTFSEAIDRLPACSYAVFEKETGGGERDVVVWFLYRQDAEEIGDPMAEDGPHVDVRGTHYHERGWEMWGIEDWMPAEEVPDGIRELEWKESPVGYEGFPTFYHVDVILRVLDGVPLEEARFMD
jgi:hypothetical protein